MKGGRGRIPWVGCRLDYRRPGPGPWGVELASRHEHRYIHTWNSPLARSSERPAWYLGPSP